MRWPFRSKEATDLRIFRDPKSDDVTLRLVGPMCIPNPENPVLTFSVTLDAKLDEEGIRRLYDQLSQFVNRPVAAEYLSLSHPE